MTSCLPSSQPVGREAEPAGYPLDSGTPFPPCPPPAPASPSCPVLRLLSGRWGSPSKPPRGGCAVPGRWLEVAGHPSRTCPPSTLCPGPGPSAARALLRPVSHLGWCNCRRPRPPAGWCPPAATRRCGSASSRQARRGADGNSPPLTPKRRPPLAARRKGRPLPGPYPEPLRSSPGPGSFSET